MDKKTFVVITGASRGLGRSIAVALAKRVAPGSTFLLMSRSLPGLNETKTLVQQHNSEIEVAVHSTDFGKPDVKEYETTIRAAFTKDFESALIVHNAGSLGNNGNMAADQIDLTELQSYFATNLHSTMILNSVFLKSSAEVKNRTVVQISSLAGVMPIESWSLYCTGKAARDMFFKVVAKENPAVTVLNYAPGPLDTEMVQGDIMSNAKTHPNIKAMFDDMVDKKGLLLPETSAEKMMEVLEAGKFTSGDHVDFYD